MNYEKVDRQDEDDMGDEEKLESQVPEGAKRQDVHECQRCHPDRTSTHPIMAEASPARDPVAVISARPSNRTYEGKIP